MLHNLDGAISIEPGFSRWLAYYLLSIHLVAMLLILLLQPPMPFTIFLMLLVSISLVYYWKRDLLHGAHRCISYVAWSEERGWRIVQPGGVMQQATLIPSSFLSRQLVILHLKTVKNGTQKLVLPGDSIQPDLHRRVRVLLKLQHHFGE